MLVLPFSDIAVEIVEDSPFATSDNLFNEEKIFIKREWSEIRLKTYILGRCAAHRALQTLQKEIVPILKGRDGEPIWPFDIVGSISHKDAIAVAAVGKKKRYKGIGVDIEDQTTILSKKEYSLFWYKDRFYTSPPQHHEVLHINRSRSKKQRQFNRKALTSCPKGGEVKKNEER